MMSYQVKMRPIPLPTILISGDSLPCDIGHQHNYPPFVFELLRFFLPRPETPPGTMKDVKVQTMYREEEAQTSPFDVDIIEPENPELEILTLGYLSWSHGLPAGMHEVEMIERARQRRAWEKAMPEPFNEHTVAIQSMVINAIEINEWAFREEEIEFLNSMRMELAAQLMHKFLTKYKTKLDVRLERVTEAVFNRRDVHLEKARRAFGREMRMLDARRSKASKKFRRGNTVADHKDKTSELWGPQMRFGDNPGRGHEAIHPQSRYRQAFSTVEILLHSMQDLPSLPKSVFDYDSASKPREHTKHMCVRETKWTASRLADIYRELRAFRLGQMRVTACRLKQRIPPAATPFFIPSVEGVPDEVEDKFQTSLFLQKTIKGRAIQAVMFEGRVRCQELIEELKSTLSLSKVDEAIAIQHRVYQLHREREVAAVRERKKQEILQMLEGKTVGDVLDFMSKELLRLQRERTTHALAMIAVRERDMREATEAGRRQAEEQRRREHDEMFKQVVKLHQNTVDMYLEEVILQSRNWLVEREAREYIHKVSKKVDQAAHEAHTRYREIEEEELIGDLIHNYALPEAKKRLLRERIQKRQRNSLRTCHDEVYGNIEKVCLGPRDPKRSTLNSLPRPLVHRVPPGAPVRLLKLRRMHMTTTSSVSNTAKAPKDRDESNKDDTLSFSHIKSIDTMRDDSVDHISTT